MVVDRRVDIHVRRRRRSNLRAVATVMAVVAMVVGCKDRVHIHHGGGRRVVHLATADTAVGTVVDVAAGSSGSDAGYGRR